MSNMPHILINLLNFNATIPNIQSLDSCIITGRLVSTFHTGSLAQTFLAVALQSQDQRAA